MTLLIRSASSARLEIVGNDTTLKPIYVGDFKEFGLVTIRNNTTLKPSSARKSPPSRLVTIRNNTTLKLSAFAN